VLELHGVRSRKYYVISWLIATRCPERDDVSRS
jgi:hypothetical protein